MTGRPPAPQRARTAPLRCRWRSPRGRVPHRSRRGTYLFDNIGQLLIHYREVTQHSTDFVGATDRDRLSNATLRDTFGYSRCQFQAFAQRANHPAIDQAGQQQGHDKSRDEQGHSM